MKDLSTEALLDLIQHHNIQYRAGEPEISDAEYDALAAELANRDPSHPWLQQVEPEPVTGKTVKLPERMLSTQKAYTLQELEDWGKKVQEAADSLGIPDFEVRITPKLDGFAAYDAGNFQATRGDGFEGTNISIAFQRGLRIFNVTPGEASGKGEIVVDREYFNKYLSDKYENTRNVIAAVIKEGQLDTEIELAIAKGGVCFVPFQKILGFHTDRFLEWLSPEMLDAFWSHTMRHTPFDTDGLVLEVVNDQIKEVMGNTNHHHRWQIAYKRNTEFHDCKVTGITWQTARTGRITPVINIEPTRIGGVTVSNVTGHHAGNVLNNNIGEGAVVKVTRAGQVIPHIVDVVLPTEVDYPTTCPCCGAVTRLEGDNLICPNTINCSAQFSGAIEHFFKTIGDCDGFGPAVIDKLCNLLTMNGVDPTIATFFINVSIGELTIAGVSEGVARNLVKALDDRRQKPLEDWKFLAAFGIPGIGRGVSEKILTKYTLQEVISMVSKNDLLAIDGIGSVLVDNLFQGLDTLSSDIGYLAGKFNLIQTKGTATVDSPIAGKTIVFTGTMIAGKRSDMEKQAKALGAIVASSVSAKTDYLVAGENVGANKTDAAKKHGVTIMTEQQYLELVA